MGHQNGIGEVSKELDVVVMMAPLPAQGHLNQLLHLSRLLSTRGFPVYYVCSAAHNRQAKSRIQGWNPSVISNLKFHDFPDPPFTYVAPNSNAVNKFPAHLVPILDAEPYLREPLVAFLKSLSSKARRVVVIHDSLLCFAANEASFLDNAEAYSFKSFSVFAHLNYYLESIGKPADKENLIPSGLSGNATWEGSFSDNFKELLGRVRPYMNFPAGYLFNTCVPLEGEFLKLLPHHPILGVIKDSWAIGPLNPVTFDIETMEADKCIKWLNCQTPNSVIYISFGTMTSVSDEQITQIALGLERSEQRFIWVLRDADVGNIFEGKEQLRKIQLPEGYEERVEGVGMIVRDWAPQLPILAHSSIGAFMSHCGWNSCMESLSMGVPIAAWPMHSDQPCNTVLVTEILKCGVVVRDWMHRNELVYAETVELAVRRLMVSKEGKAIRNHANEVGIAVREAVSKGGSSSVQLDSFLTHILRV